MTEGEKIIRINIEEQMKSAMDAAPRGHLLNPGIRDALHAGIEHLQSIEGVDWLNEADFDIDSMTPPNAVFKVSGEAFFAEKELAEEVFGPVTLLVACRDEAHHQHRGDRRGLDYGCYKSSGRRTHEAVSG